MSIIVVACPYFCMLIILNNKQLKKLMHTDLGPIRRKFVQSLAELQRLSHAILEGERIMRGTVYEMKRKCGGANFICVTEGKLHATMVISWSEEGKTRIKTLSDSDIDDYVCMSRKYKEFRQIRRHIEKIFQSLLNQIDLIETKRRKEP